MFRILLAMVIGGGVLVFFGVQEMRLAGSAKAEPTTISCAKLGDTGPGDNAHVVVTDVQLTDAYCVQTKKRSSTWSTVWVPVVPSDGEYVRMIEGMVKSDGALPAQLPPPKDIRVLLKSTKVRSESELNALSGQPTIQGMIVNKVASIGGKEKEILAQNYPGVNFDTVYILEHGREPASSGKSFGMMGGGALLSCIGVLGFFRGKKSA